MSAEHVDEEEVLAAEALVRALEGASFEGPEHATIVALEARRDDIDVDLARVRSKVLRRVRRTKLRVVAPVALMLAAAAAVMLSTSRRDPVSVTLPEPDLALLEAQVRAATERGLRTDLDVEAWRYRRQLLASMQRRYDR
jgi:hypothetical protein